MQRDREAVVEVGGGVAERKELLFCPLMVNHQNAVSMGYNFQMKPL